jgi:hypothetical protein
MCHLDSLSTSRARAWTGITGLRVTCDTPLYLLGGSRAVIDAPPRTAPFYSGP